MTDPVDVQFLPLMELIIDIAERREKARSQLHVLSLLVHALEAPPTLVPADAETREAIDRAIKMKPDMERRLLELNSLLHWLGKVRA